MIDQAIVIGAGFSFYAGLPLQSKFTAELLRASSYHKGPSKRLVEFLCEFVSDTFHPGEELDPDKWPDLEDLFTCIDLSANSGHHLGAGHAPGKLRTVRRALIARIIRMLRKTYDDAKNDPDDDNWQFLEQFLMRVEPNKHAFISLNWDTVAEERMLELHPNLTLKYGPSFVAADFPETGTSIARVPRDKLPALRIAKIHGSINWLYCDNCRKVFWFPPAESLQIADQLLSRDEWRQIAPRAPGNAKKQWECSECASVRLSTRIATFSYRKALDFPMFQQSWNAAERLLANARRWVFIGYSLPAADYEFKYLLKRIELARAASPPDIILVTGGKAANTTRKNYRRFFGDRLNRQEFQDGLDDDAIAYITA